MHAQEVQTASVTCVPRHFAQMIKYNRLKNLGEGAFGDVFQAQNKSTGEVVAVKHIKKNFRSWTECLQLRELQSLKKLKHQNIVALKELVQEKRDGSLYFVFEFIDSNLYKLISASRGGLSSGVIASVMQQLLSGLSHMHKHG